MKLSEANIKSKSRIKRYSDKEIETVYVNNSQKELVSSESDSISWDKPFRYGYPIDVNLNLNSSGNWINLQNGDRIWVLKIVAKNAYSLNLTFNQFFIPEGGELFIYNGEKTMLQGPITSKFNNEKGLMRMIS